MTDVSAVALRTMGPRAILSGNGDALDNINTFELPDGATCFVVANRTNYRLDKESVAIPAPPTIIAPIAGPGRWIADSGGGAAGEPLSNILFADLNTVVPLADQNGAIVLPFSTAEVLVTAVEALADNERTGYLTPGDYSANTIDLAVSARYASFAPTYEGIRQDRIDPNVLLDLNITEDITLTLFGIDLQDDIAWDSGEGLEGELFLEDCRVEGVVVGDIAAVNTEFDQSGTLHFENGFMKDCFINTEDATAINIDGTSFMMLGMAFSTGITITFMNSAGVITVDETTAAAMVASGVVVANGTVVVLELEQLSNVFYVDVGTLVPAYLQNGAQGMPYGSLATALTTVLPVTVNPTFILTEGDYLVAHAVTENCRIQGLPQVTSLRAPVLNFVDIVGPTLSDDVFLFLADLRTLGATTVGLNAVLGFTDCTMGAIDGGDISGENSALTGNVTGVNISLSDCTFNGGVTVNVSGTISLHDCIVQGNLTAVTVNLTSTTFAGAITITADVNTDVASYTSLIKNGGSITGTVTFTDDPGAYQTWYWTADDGDVDGTFGRLMDWSYGNAVDQTNNQLVMPGSGRCGVFFAKMKGGNAGANSTYTLFQNGVSSGIAVTILNGGSFAIADASTITWVQEDRFSVEITDAPGAPGLVDIGLTAFPNAIAF